MPLIDAKPTSLGQLWGVTAAQVKRLKNLGIANTEQLLLKAATPRAERRLASEADMARYQMRELVNRADLVRLSSIGPKLADLLENAGVNSLKELAQRQPQALHRTLGAYASSRPELGYRAPSLSTVKGLVEAAAQFTRAGHVEKPITSFAQAEAAGRTAMHRYVDEVLFGKSSEGKPFRDAVLSFRTPAERKAVQQRMHADVDAFLSRAERSETGTAYVFVGGWRTEAGNAGTGLYTEVALRKSGGVERVFVEID